MSTTVDNIPHRSPLAIDTAENETNNDESDTTPLRTKVLSLVKEAPNYTVRPSTLSKSLGISLNDANAELCGLLQAVGEGSSFHFETIDNVKVMVFKFPPDFERRALREQRIDDWRSTLKALSIVTIKALKVLTAFGLILSTIIVSIAGMLALIAAFVALSRDAGGHSRGTRTQLTRQMHNLFLTVRQLLWCYAMFGPMGEGNEDPFFREAAYDTWLVLSLCCGNPGNIFFWWRASHLRQRRQRYSRGWGSGHSRDNLYDSGELEGVSLIRRNRSTGEEERLPVPSSTEDHRGLLSSLVEFLFGPTMSLEPSEADRWRLRGAVILEKATNETRNTTSVSLQELMPYSDSPPSSLNDDFTVIREGLSVVAHFNGVPASTDSPQKQAATSQARFDFPELLAEGSGNVRYDDPRTWEQGQSMPEKRNRWDNFFYSNEATSTNTVSRPATTIPIFLFERPVPFSLLTRNQFLHCLLIAILNFIGVIWFAQSVQLGGILHDYLNVSVGNALRSGIIPVLWFYARLFLLIPLLRLFYLLIRNEQCYNRNKRRSDLAGALKQL
ncbi:hypothetical protein IV203_037986 [Nitzschia inconspicua]|uniref:Uncharacterized protein n=1 Tax=Nitzschia inconspicua TaxID=303405 RepID=A0A9K3Q1H5_9STRA|nr:hypothetical protein IV203_037986 [Nitzschia inconspicua]